MPSIEDYNVFPVIIG